MKGRLLQGLIVVWVIMLSVPATVWILGHVDRLTRTTHVAGQWSIRVNSKDAGKISLVLNHDRRVPVVGPPFGPGLSYTPQLLAWYDQWPSGIFRNASGFSYVEDNDYFIDSNKHMVLMGRVIYLGMPYLAEWILLLPLPFLTRQWLKHLIVARQLRRGHCPQCDYDVRSTPTRCPECGLPLDAAKADL